MNSVKPYSPREQDYIRRVAGKVPAHGREVRHEKDARKT